MSIFDRWAESPETIEPAKNPIEKQILKCHEDVKRYHECIERNKTRAHMLEQCRLVDDLEIFIDLKSGAGNILKASRKSYMNSEVHVYVVDDVFLTEYQLHLIRKFFMDDKRYTTEVTVYSKVSGGFLYGSDGYYYTTYSRDNYDRDEAIMRNL
jgi:hypothetical protein